MASTSVVPADTRFPDGRLPAVDASASAYGDDVRTGPDGHPNADDLAGIAERQRQQGHPGVALQLAERVLTYAPDNAQALKTQISSLSNLGAHRRAEQLREQYQPNWPQATQRRFDADVATVAIRDGIQEQARLERRHYYVTSNTELEKSLDSLNANLERFPPGSEASLRTRFDRLVVWRRLNRFEPVIDDYQALQRESANIPTYAKGPVAEAYLARRQPQTAARLYREVIDANPQAPLSVRTGYYYALIESEDYAGAAQQLARLDDRTPTWRYRENETAAPVPNWERSEIDRLRVRDAAYRNHEDVALDRATTLYRAAPRNTDVINALATAERARGWYQQAQATIALAKGYAPNDKATRLNIAENAQDLEAFTRWRATSEALAEQFPSDSAVRRNRLEWLDRQHFSVEGQGSVGSSHGGDAVNGSQDGDYQLRLNSPWSEGGYRAYVEQSYQWGEYDEGAQRHGRQGLGVERQWLRRHWWAALSGERLNDDLGLDLGWSQWLGDHWQYQLRTQTQSPETPLRAERDDLDGRLYQTQLTWRQNESREATLTLGALDISDGNLRSDISADLTQRIQASAHHQTRLIGSLSAEHNRDVDADYYNPENQRTAGITLEHDWLTWRRYDRSLTQNLALGAASEWESGYGGAPGYEASYGHTWQLTRTWSINYGIGWESHAYEGEREKRWYGQFGFEGGL
ncbi:poly-beta-1,6 N-acetyl-D-glucosamine export porin PgaA [Chromohalobacter nigrandesensis]|uniref:poly-beta-1,6 N-acetyl-D-glucosamine export porin PgaA n=1 Tax=Chromohalobacter nigrandesensis TaxID=119863 RepID=UPI001FF4CEA2|nr:poly-beta-1,6 N-acetyl-D-glucosamine export porin PgaA [Chromohalobacter nigrandesensis]MCK0746685.1 poly-beta-1,6 N-acetyl-D-glucosamine export porin PgaA [Chromohalobacter nigrandesensis]